MVIVEPDYGQYRGDIIGYEQREASGYPTDFHRPNFGKIALERSY